MLVFLFVICAWVLVSHLCPRGLTPERLERLIQTELSTGCERQLVEGWLAKHSIPSAYFADTTGDRHGRMTMPMLAGLRDEDLSGMMRGLIGEPGTSAADLACGRRIAIYFFFDKSGHLVGHFVQEATY
jgi:hypothetical protein